MPTHDEVVEALANRIYELEAEDGRRLDFFAPLLKGPLYTVFSSWFIAALAERIPVGSSDILQNMHSILHDQKFGMQGFEETIIAGELVPAEPALSLQEKVNLIFHYFILNEPRDIFENAGITRIVNRNKLCQHLYKKLLPGQESQLETNREHKREEMLEDFFHSVASESLGYIKQGFIVLIDAGIVSIAGREVAIRCPITQRFMVNPVKIEEDNRAYYFERDALNAWMLKNKINPLTNLPLNSQPKPAPEMRYAIQQLMIEYQAKLAKDIHSVKHKTVMQDLATKQYYQIIQPNWGRKKLTWTPQELKEDRPEPKSFIRAAKRNKKAPG